jgi:hypothetical protein
MGHRRSLAGFGLSDYRLDQRVASGAQRLGGKASVKEGLPVEAMTAKPGPHAG